MLRRDITSAVTESMKGMLGDFQKNMQKSMELTSNRLTEVGANKKPKVGSSS